MKTIWFKKSNLNDKLYNMFVHNGYMVFLTEMSRGQTS